MRRLALALLVVLSLASPGWAGQNILDTDSFGGTNGTALPTYNANWVTVAPAGIADASIQGTPGVGPSSVAAGGANSRTGQTWTNDQFAELKIDGTNLASILWYVGVRTATGTGGSLNGYFGGFDPAYGNTTYRIVRYDLNSRTNLVAGTNARAANDVVNLEVVGTTLNLYVNGILECTTTDATYASGDPGLFLWETSTVRLGGTWKAGSVTAGGGGAVRRRVISQ